MVSPVTATFDGQAHGVTAHAVGSDGSDLGPITITYSSDTVPVHAGTYNAVVNFAGNTDFSGSTATTTVTINTANVTFDLADIDCRVEAVARIVEGIGTQQAPLAGQCIDHYFRDCRTVGKIKERMPGHGLGIPMHPWCGIEAIRPQLNPLQIRLHHQLVKRQRLRTGADDAIGELHLAGIAGKFFGGDRAQALANLQRSILCGLAVEVATGRGSSCRGIGDLAGVGGATTHPLQRQAECMGNHLRHLGIEPLAHFGATMIDQYRTIGVDVH